MLSLWSGPHTGTLNQSTHKSKEFNSSKFTSAAADTEAIANERMGAESTMGGEDKGALELIDHLLDDERKANDYDVPRSVTVTATTFGKGSAKASDYDVPRPVIVTATMFEEGSIKDEEF